MQIGQAGEQTGSLLNAYSKARQTVPVDKAIDQKSAKIIENNVANNAVILDLSPEAQQLILSGLRG